MRVIVPVFLAIAVFVSAVWIVISEYETRRLFVEVLELEKERDALNEEWGRIQLERSTWATNDRIEFLARTALEMISPEQKMIVLLMK